MNKIIFALVFVLASSGVFGQSAFLTTESRAIYLVQRYEIKEGRFTESLNTDILPFARIPLQSFIDSLEPSTISSSSDEFNLQYLNNENYLFNDKAEESKNPIFGEIYENQAGLYDIQKKDIFLTINPVLGLRAGTEEPNNRFLFRNTRGIRINGQIDQKIGFYTYIGENQARLPSYYDTSFNTNGSYPRIGLFKNFANNTAVDWADAKGHIHFPLTKHVSVQFGHDRNFIGNGNRSLLLSDFSRDYLFLKVNTKIWKFHYQNLLTEFTSLRNRGTGYPKKFGAFHYLSIDILKNLRLGLFEGIIYADIRETGRGIDFNYFNPIIFYRAVDHKLGSPDNALIGMNINYYPLPKVQFYGQLLLDEFKLNELRAQDGWWANKFGIQTGLRYIDALGINNLDLNVEFNLVKPYTYTHDTIARAYTQYNQPLAHPLGANFYETLASLRYQFFKRFEIRFTTMNAISGKDRFNRNWGGNITKEYSSREREYGNYLAQGLKTNIFMLRGDISYMLRHNLFIEFNYFNRSETNSMYDVNQTYYGLGLRLNFFENRQLF